MGIDATRTLGAPAGRLERIRIPGYEQLRLEDYINE